MVTKPQVLAMVKEQKSERGIEHWNKLGEKTGGLKSFGLGLTQLRKLAKQIGRDSSLAAKLWNSDVYELKVLSLLIDEPKRLTRERAEQQVEELAAGMLSHVFSSCDATLAKTPFAFELAKDWMKSEDPVRRRCGYGLIYELCKRNPKGMDDSFLIRTIEHIEATIHREEMWVREAMNTALMGIGKRSGTLNRRAIEAAQKIGPVDIDYGDDNSCQPLDVLKHLTSESLQKRLAADPAG